MVVRKTKTDRRDALHILDLLRHDRFPTIWVPERATCARSSRTGCASSASAPWSRMVCTPSPSTTASPVAPSCSAGPVWRSCTPSRSPAHGPAPRSQPPVTRRAQRADP
jgi:hypothetical protein